MSMTWKEMLIYWWNIMGYQLFELEGYPISLGKLLSGVILLVLSFFVSQRLAKLVDRRVLVRFNMDESLRYTFRSLSYYFFLFLSVLFTLRTLHVPLTVFTVMGGALAVGVGFGSQNLMNNFISGLLVMMERPIRVSDYIEVDGIRGRVQSIGIRSTLVRSLSNTLVVIPNKTFIEKNLTNWTMSGTFSTSVRFQVANGTDARKLREVCLKAVQGLDGITVTPPPGLAFVDFAENGLIFSLGLSLEAGSFPRSSEVESEIRFRLSDAFRAEGIQMPFQRGEIRLSVEEPLPVRLPN